MDQTTYFVRTLMNVQQETPTIAVLLKHASILLEVIAAVAMMALSLLQTIPVLISMNVGRTLVKIAKVVLIQNVFYQKKASVLSPSLETYQKSWTLIKISLVVKCSVSCWAATSVIVITAIS